MHSTKSTDMYTTCNDRNIQRLTNSLRLSVDALISAFSIFKSLIVTQGRLNVSSSSSEPELCSEVVVVVLTTIYRT